MDVQDVQVVQKLAHPLVQKAVRAVHRVRVVMDVRHLVRAVRAVHPVRAVVNQDVTAVADVVHARGIVHPDAAAHAEQGVQALAIASVQDARPPVQARAMTLARRLTRPKPSLIWARISVSGMSSLLTTSAV